MAPLYLGWLCAFALATTAYILLAIQLEERDLVAVHGADYLEYRERTPMIVSSLGLSRGGTRSAKHPRTPPDRIHQSRTKKKRTALLPSAFAAHRRNQALRSLRPSAASVSIPSE